MGVQTYDPKKILMSLGTHQVTGYADGTFINYEPGGDGVTKVVGCDGEVARSLNPDATGKLTPTLLAYSPTVAWAQKQYELDKQTGDGMFPVLVKDLKGNTVISSANGWIVKSPAREYGRETPTREIEIDLGEVTIDG